MPTSMMLEVNMMALPVVVMAAIDGLLHVMAVGGIFLDDARQQVDAVVDTDADAHHRHDAGIDVETDAQHLHGGHQVDVGEVDRYQQDDGRHQRTIGADGEHHHRQVHHHHDDGVIALDDVVHGLLQRNHAGREAHLEVGVIFTDRRHRAARGIERRVHRFLLVVLVPGRHRRVLEGEIGDVPEVDGVGAELGGEAHRVHGVRIEIELRPLWIAAGYQARGFGHVIGERQGRARRHRGIGFQRALQLGPHFHRVGLQGHAVVDVVGLGLQHDLQRIGAREMRVDRAHAGVELRIRPQEVAALDRVANLDQAAEVAGIGADEDHHQRRPARGGSEGQA
jgi:hypothetical protein